MSEAASYLLSAGFDVTDHFSSDVTHLLLPVPSQGDDTDLLSQLPGDVVVCGGNLEVPAFQKFNTIDMLKDPDYLDANAAITAECAANLPGIEYQGIAVLILGWGRIGKRLSAILKSRGAVVTVSARNPMDLAKISALGMEAIPIGQIQNTLQNYRVIFNTVPAMVLPNLVCLPDCLVYELASRPGMAGEHIISARGLPSKYAPIRSGNLIAQTFIRLSNLREG